MFKAMQLKGGKGNSQLACVPPKSMLFAYIILSSEVTVLGIHIPLVCWHLDKLVSSICIEKFKKKTKPQNT